MVWGWCNQQVLASYYDLGGKKQAKDMMVGRQSVKLSLLLTGNCGLRTYEEVRVM